MKKLFFTAIAMVAFSGSAMANSVAKKNLETKTNSLDWTCHQEVTAKLDRIEKMGCLEATVRESLYNQYMARCQN